MHTAKVIEIICCSSKGFEDAIQCGIAEASQTLRGLRSAWVKDQSVCIEDNSITKYKVILKLTFEIEHQ
jgi:flavin-binding protein dodecin